MGWRPAGPAETAPAARPLRHEPMLQGRVGPTVAPLPGAAGLAAGHGTLARAGLDDLWSGLPGIIDSVETAAARRGTVPPLDRLSPAGRMLDQLRGQVLRVVSERGWRRIGIGAPRRGAGASFVALGLAASIARLDYLRVLLADLDLSRPSLHDHLGVTPPGGLEPALSGGVPFMERIALAGPSLALLLNDTPIAEAAEVLHSPEAVLTLRELATGLRPDLMLIDMPPLLSDPSAQALLSHLDTVLLVADGTRSTARDISECERLLDGQLPLLGVVLNKSEDRPTPASQG